MQNSVIFYELYDAQEFDHFIRNVIKQFRNSIEYRKWLDRCDRNVCAATGLSKSDDNVEIEVHHYEKTTWDWASYIIDKLLEANVPFNSFFVSMILAEIHLQDCVSYVPLLHCIHKMIHDNYDNTLQLYPSIEAGVHPANMKKADEIISYYIDLYKKHFAKEEE